MKDASFMFYAATLGFIFGIALASSITLNYYDVLFGILIATASGVLFRHRQKVSYIFFSVVILCTSLGIARFECAEQHIVHTLDAYENKKVVIEGVVILEPDKREKSTHITIAVEKVGEEKSDGTVLVHADRVSKVLYGDRVTVRGVLNMPDAFETEFGRTFDYPRYLKSQGVGHVMSFVRIEVLSHGHGFNVVSALFSFKSRLSNAIDSVLLEPESGLALGLLLGEKHALSKDLLASFRNAGLIHIVVLSGYNIAILILALLWALSFFSLRTRTVVAVCVIILFVLMVGPSATVLRAALMAGLVLLAQVTQRTYAILRALIITGVALLVYNPYLLVYDPGFQLSFLATLGLILVSPHIETLLVRIPNIFSLKGFAVSTLATQIMVLPILSYAIGAVSVVALVANMLVLPLVPFAMLLSALAGFLYLFFPTFGIFVGYPAYVVLSFIISVGDVLGKMSFSSVVLPQFSFMWVIVAYIGIGGVLGYLAVRVQREAHSPPKVVAKPQDDDVFRF